jgi:hypothetical protein
MKHFYYSSLLMLAGAFWLSSCDNQQEAIPEPIAENVIHPKLDDPLYMFAQNVASALEQKEVRSFIKDNALKRFDGDYDILYAKVKDEVIQSGPGKRSSTFEEAIFGENNSNSRVTNELLNEPLLQISMPELPETSAEEWDVENYKPIVVYRPIGSLDGVTHLPAIDGEGNSIQFDITKYPTKPIIVVGHNERVIAIPKEGKSDNSNVVSYMAPCPAASEPYFEDQNNIYYLKEDYYSNCDGGGGYAGGGGGTGGTGSSSCDRDVKNKYDYVSRLKFKDIDAFRDAEKYVDGNPEMFCILILGANTPSGFTDQRKYISSPDRSKWKDCGVFTCSPEWFYANQEVFNWNKTDFGKIVRYDWYEEDAGETKVTYSVSHTTTFDDGTKVTGTVEFLINPEDTNLGSSFVNYCDNTDGYGEDYDTGRLIFHVNQQ